MANDMSDVHDWLDSLVNYATDHDDATLRRYDCTKDGFEVMRDLLHEALYALTSHQQNLLLLKHGPALTEEAESIRDGWFSEHDDD